MSPLNHGQPAVSIAYDAIGGTVARNHASIGTAVAHA